MIYTITHKYTDKIFFIKVLQNQRYRSFIISPELLQNQNGYY